MSKCFAEHCERNKQPILDQLEIYFKSSRRVLEIGSGTGQHAIFFAEKLPHLIWHTSDMPENHDSVNAWITESQLINITPPVKLTIGRDTWPDVNVDAVFTANTTHIMQPEEVQQMMALVALNLPENGVFCQYGPMMVDGDHTSESNRKFDQKIKNEGFGGIRSIEELTGWGKEMKLVERIPMPSNNFLLVWRGSKVTKD
jgi:cyclopropane fatty-acyl-phospholipid synthase-like methyltransferase